MKPQNQFIETIITILGIIAIGWLVLTLINQAKEIEKETLELLKDFDTWKEWKNKLMSN
jgi:hypothetical protein